MTAEQQATAGNPQVPGRPATNTKRPWNRPTEPLPNGVPRDAAYWARIERIVDAAPEFTTEQRAEIRLAIWGGRTTRTGSAA